MKQEEKISSFEQVFGKNNDINSDLSDLLAICRDDFWDELQKFIPETSLVSSPECVLYAMYRSIEEKLKK